MKKFAEIVDDLGLVDLPLQEGDFTWNGGHNNQAWARLDRFLVSRSWLDQFSGITQSRLPRPISDHFPIMLVGGIEVRGSASFKLAAKMKEIKQKLKVWNREIFGRLDCNKSSALQQVDFWDRKESKRSLTVEETELKKETKENYKKWVLLEETHWRHLSREIWLREGDRNTEEEEIREGIASAFHQLLSEDKGWKANIGRLRFDQISQQEAENLERFFTNDEIHAALMEMNGDKAPVLANRLKKVVGKVVSTSQNAFVRGRQIFGASLIANEVIDSWQKRKEKGLICKLDIEKAYNSINWKFLLKVLQKMGFGSKWLGWMWSCLSSAKFSVLVNGVSVGFFPSTKGLRQGDPLSPYLFVMGMEMLDVLIRRAVEGGFLSGKEHLTHLSWILLWFEVASGLRINLAKSEIISIGEVVQIEELAVELGCRVGSLPSQYLRLSLGAPNRAPYMWDGVEERKARESAKGLPVGGGNMEGKIHLVNWEVVCTDKEKGGLGLRKLAILNKALLGKWIWRYACDKDNLWKQVIKVKYGQEGLGWKPKKANGAGNKIRFWTDVWCTDKALSIVFLISSSWLSKGVSTIEEMWDQNSGQEGWNLNFLKYFNDWKLDMVGDLLHMLRGHRLLWRKTQFFGGKEEMVSSGSRKLIVC
ncbi:LINE-1 reverse transcriptase-like [Vitis vinifera]|uniref:LINE-1 reverse transcriptase-like n=1 Tax=Vitis vinifera TaxID=29760 RepID=A0A438I894_VITVI|nr:LINE-1 reverse transcriptase-like [Vitis vinifera]